MCFSYQKINKRQHQGNFRKEMGKNSHKHSALGVQDCMFCRLCPQAAPFLRSSGPGAESVLLSILFLLCGHM